MTADRAATDPLVHRALGSPVRARLLEFLRDESGLDVVALSERLELHVNTVRSHLVVLERAGLVASVAEQRDRPGRPRLRYRTTATANAVASPAPLAAVAETTDAPSAGGPTTASVPDAAAGPVSPDERAYRFLAGILASYLDATTTDSAAAAHDAGAAWGHYVVDRPAPFTRVDAVEAIDRIRGLMHEFGFAPEVDVTDPAAPRVVLHRCPFGDLARQHQDVVCSVHLGLLRGAFEELDAPVHADSLVPWATPQTCVAHLRATPV